GVEGENLLGLDLALLLDDGLEQLLLRIEINVERALRHPRPAGDIAHAGGIEAMLQEHGAGPFEDLPALGVLLLFGGLRVCEEGHAEALRYFDRTVRLVLT